MTKKDLLKELDRIPDDCEIFWVEEYEDHKGVIDWVWYPISVEFFDNKIMLIPCGEGCK